MEYRGHVRNGTIVLDPPDALPEGTAVRVEPLVEASSDTAIHSQAFWEPRSFKDLAAQQDVHPIEFFENALGGWPEDELDDGFEDAVIRWRQAELERHE